MTVLLYFTISTIGLGLFTLARAYQKLGIHKSRVLRLSFAAENGAKQAFAALAAAVAGRVSAAEISPGRFAELREATAAGEIILAEDALGLDIPFEVAEAEGAQAWRSVFSLGPGNFQDRGGYFLAGFRGGALSEGRIQNSLLRKTAALDLEIKILAGRIPLNYLPLLVAGPGGPSSLGELVAEKRIEVLQKGGRRVTPGPASTAAELIPADATPLLEEALKIKILTPGKISRAQLRQALGLEMVNEPVPDGVYLINSDSGLGGVFVQGDVEELVLAADAGWQYVRFALEEGIWMLRFNPSRFETVFEEPTGPRSYDRTPLPMILVNGRILSLGGGRVDSQGKVAMTSDPDSPSVLSGVSLTLVCADEITLSSHLVQESVRWIDGVPYLKDSQSQLVLYANGRDFVDGAERSGKIKVGGQAPRDLQVHAAVTARGGFQVEEGPADVLVAGSLQASVMDLGTSRLKLAPDERLFSGALPPAASPRTTVPLIWILSLEPLLWRE